MKRLIFRLSSLGDVVLVQSILEPPYAGETHWVVAKEFESLLQRRPGLTKVWSYDRKKNRGLGAWIQFLARLKAEGFNEVLDVHSTLRTWIARLYFRLLAENTQWKTLSKERWRRFGYVLLKRAWPSRWRPTHLSRRAALMGGGYGNERPNLRWMVRESSLKLAASPATAGLLVAIVPGSAWPGKEWPTNRYIEWRIAFQAKFPDARYIVFGTSQDRAARSLAEQFSARGLAFEDAIGRYALPEVAGVLADCDFVLGGDTGLLHLAEAVGTRVLTVFGPTRNDFGFGAQDERSLAAQTSLWCSPCSKDGSLCFRVTRRYACLTELESARVVVLTDRMGKQKPGETGPSVQP